MPRIATVPRERVTFSDPYVKSVKCRQGFEREEIPDPDLPGFYLAVTAKGSKSWRIRFDWDRLPDQHTIGKYPLIKLSKAREIARELRLGIASGVHPKATKVGSKQPGFNLIANLVERWLAWAPVQTPSNPEPLSASTLVNYRSSLRKNFLPAFHKRTVQSITEQEIEQLRDLVFTTRPQAARLMMKALRGLFAYAVHERLLTNRTNPVAFVDLGPHSTPRSRRLTPAELRLVWLAAADLPPTYRALARLLIVSGKRRTEIQNAPAGEWDLRRGVLTIAAERTKQRREDQVPIVPLMVEILLETNERPHDGRTMLGVGTGGGRVARMKAALDQAIAKRLAAEAGVPYRQEVPLSDYGFEPWVWHDLRRSINHIRREIGIEKLMREDLLAHSRGKLGITYDPDQHLALKRRAMRLAEAALRQIIAGTYVSPEITDAYEDLTHLIAA